MNAASYSGLRFDLGETADMLRESVRAFAAGEIAPRAADIDATKIELIAEGAAGPAALHAAAFDDRIAKVTVKRSIDTWL